MRLAARLVIAILTLSPFVALESSLAADTYRGGVPQFEQFPAPPYFRGKNAPPDLSDPDARYFRTRLREGAKEAPNYAGIHTLVTWGCGTSCRAGAAVNAVTGRVVFLPDAFSGIHVRADSRLLILTATGGTGGPGLLCFFDFDGISFHLVRAIGDDPDPQSFYWPPMSCAGLAGMDWSPDRLLLIVRTSGGGSVDQFQGVRERVDRTGASVRIEGPCMSACAVFLTAKQVCLAETASIGVHGASRAGELDAALTRKWANEFHPAALRAWAESVGAYDSLEMTMIDAPKLWEMGIERCQPVPEDLRQTMAKARTREQTDFQVLVKALEHETEAALSSASLSPSVPIPTPRR